MEYILGYLKYMLLSIPIIIIIRLIINRNKKTDIKKEVLFTIFISFVVGLYSQALKFGDKESSFINLIPFKIIISDIMELFKGNILLFLLNILGNIVLFIPFGIFIPMIWNIKDKYVILIGFLGSLIIEISQLFLDRVTDIDDLILNTLGVVIGLCIYKSVKKKKTN